MEAGGEKEKVFWMWSKLSWIRSAWKVRWCDIMLVPGLKCFFFSFREIRCQLLGSPSRAGRGLCLDVLERAVLIVPLYGCLNPHLCQSAEVPTISISTISAESLSLHLSFWLMYFHRQISEATELLNRTRRRSSGSTMKCRWRRVDTCGQMINTGLPHCICLVMKRLLVRLLCLDAGSIIFDP